LNVEVLRGKKKSYSVFEGREHEDAFFVLVWVLQEALLFLGVDFISIKSKFAIHL